MKKTYTTYINGKTKFDVLIDDYILNLIDDSEPTPKFPNKALLSLVNKFEDGKWKNNVFRRFLWDNIKETALSAEEREALIGDEGSILEKSASKLRQTQTAESMDGEIGEIFLYGIMRHYYKALPIVPKIFYKQNARGDYAKGADSVHLVIDDNRELSFWLGESKFYSEVGSNLFSKLHGSISELLESDKLRKEFNIITSLKDLELVVDDASLVEEVHERLSDGFGLDELKKHLHIPILILHECDRTKAENGKNYSGYCDDIAKFHYQTFQKLMKTLDTKLNNTVFCYEYISFHLVIFPVPDKDKIITQYKTQVEQYCED